MSIDKKLGHSKKTEALIQRMCRNVEREDFDLDKEVAQEKILQTYDMFGLYRPKNVVWIDDIFDSTFQDAARSAGSAWSARSARSAGSAWSARSAGSAGSARSAWSARSAGSARSARSAWSARSAGSAGSAIDYEFDWYVMEYEYTENPSDAPINESDKKYLEYCELLMQAKEAGAGYRIEYADTLYIVPTPISRLDTQNRLHCEDGPALFWKNGWSGYFLKGESFDEKLWRKIVDKSITLEEVMQIEDADKREIAFSMLGAEEMLKGLNAKLLHTGKKDSTRLYQCDNFRDTGETKYLMVMNDPGTPRQFVEGVPDEIGKKANADVAQAAAMGLTLKQYMSIELRA